MTDNVLVRRINKLQLAADQFLRFGIVGVAGFLVDSAVLYASLYLGAGLYGGRVISYLCAATTTWALNRRFTFRAHGRADKRRQWIRFVLVNLVGGGVNYGVYSLLVYNFSFVAEWPVFAVAAGSIAGLCINFTLSKSLVFRQTTFI